MALIVSTRIVSVQLVNTGKTKEVIRPVNQADPLSLIQCDQNVATGAHIDDKDEYYIVCML